MRASVIALGVIVCGIVSVVAIYEFGYTHRFRYRLTIDVTVDGVLKSGSGVIQVTGRPDLVPGRPLKYTLALSGDAVEVDLGSRGNLFALLTFRDGFNAAYLPSKAFFHTATSADRAEQEERFRRLDDLVQRRARAELRPDQLPILVMFKDRNDRKTMTQVAPNDLAAAFGPGVQLARAVVEMTRDSVTSGIEARLPWLRNTTGYVDDRTTPNQQTLTNRLLPSHFTWTSDFGGWLR